MEKVRPNKNNICAVIVSYHPDKIFEKNVELISAQVQYLLIVDNGSSESEITMLNKICKNFSNIKLLLNNDNMGIAYALNQGFCWASENSFKWVLTLDQDSQAKAIMVDTLIDIYNQIENKDNIGIIGSNHINPNVGSKYNLSKTDSETGWFETTTVITAGSLIPIWIYDSIGPFRNEFFIDLVDLEYCLRVRSLGYKIYKSYRPLLKQQIGNCTIHSVLWYKTGTSNHSALRRYYMARNHTVLIREYYNKDTEWVIKSIISRIKTIILIIIFENNKLLKLKLTILGFIDGMNLNFDRRLNIK